MVRAFDLDRLGALCSRRNLLISALVGFGLSIFLIGKLLFSGFSIMDDHSMVLWMGPTRHLALSQIWPTLMSTEVGLLDGRYRPVMYGSIVFQTWLWGPHPALYHIAPVLWFGIFLWSVAWVCFRSIGIIPGCAILFLIVNGYYWPDIFTHSALVSEQPALLGLGLIVFGFGLVSTWFVEGARKNFDAALLLVSVGSLICVGSKENFMPPVGLSVLLWIVAWRVKRAGTRALAVAAFLNLLGIAICCRIVIPNLVHPTDMYGYDSSLGYRLRTVYHSSLLKYVLLALSAGAAAALFGLRDKARRDTRDARGIIMLGMLLIAAGLYLGWEIFFYDGRLPYGQRYDFPAVMIFPVLAAAGFYAAIEVRKRSAWTQKHFSPLALQFCFVLLTLNAAIFTYIHGRLLPIIHSVAISNSHTRNMVKDLQATRALTSPHPDWMILVVPGRPIDYETVVMIPTWFHFYEISNPASLFVDIPPQKIVTALDRQLLQNLQWVSTHGDKVLQFVPTTVASVASAEAQGHCYIVTLQDTKSRCTRLPYRPEAYFPE